MNSKPTVQMLGRFQPFHKGHQELLKRALAKTGQVAILVRDMPLTKDNPIPSMSVKADIEDVLKDMGVSCKVKVFVVPNIVNITYGRDVGYVIEQEHFDADIEAISATKIRESEDFTGHPV